MKKRIERHIKRQDLVKVYIVDRKDSEMVPFEGIIFEQSDEFLFMCDTIDFTYAGMVVLRKRDISEINHTDQDKFFKYMLEKEKISDFILQRKEALDFKLGGFKEMFEQIKSLNRPIVIECNYGKKDRFIIGPINEIQDKKVGIDHFNVRGEYDLRPVSVKFKDITFFKLDSPYAEIYSKYAHRME